jgi:hypothetical protein
LATTLAGPGAPPQPDPREERLGEGPHLDDGVRWQGPERSQTLSGEAELTVGHVLRRKPVATGQFHQGPAPIRGEAQPGGVLMVGDGVEEFGDPPCGKTALEGLGVESIVIDGQALDVGLVPS